MASIRICRNIGAACSCVKVLLYFLGIFAGRMSGVFLIFLGRSSSVPLFSIYGYIQHIHSNPHTHSYILPHTYSNTLIDNAADYGRNRSWPLRQVSSPAACQRPLLSFHKARGVDHYHAKRAAPPLHAFARPRGELRRRGRCQKDG